MATGNGRLACRIPSVLGIRDDSLALAKGLGEAGRPLVIDLAESEAHGFLHEVHPSGIADAAIERIGSWVHGLAGGCEKLDSLADIICLH